MLFKRAPKLIFAVTLVWAVACLLPNGEAEAGRRSVPVVQQAQVDGGSSAASQGRITPIVQSNSVGDPDDYATDGTAATGAPKSEGSSIWEAIQTALNTVISLLGGAH